MPLHKTFVLMLLLTMVALGCSTPPKVNSELKPAAPERSGSALAPQRSIMPEYRLGFGDVVEIKVFENERFNETVAVRPDGRLTLQKIGDILVTGMTPSQLDSLITGAYAKFIRNPEITVFIRQFGDYQVYVLGEVNLPGGYPLQKNMNILQAIAAAGGFKESAERQNVMRLRPGRQDEIVASKLDLKAAVQGNINRMSEEEFYVQAQDVIYVPRTFISSASAFLKQVYDGALTPVDVYLRALWWRAR